ncbi:MAG: hypothetical protein SGI73_16025 [Chloroflexota bacterium]|nr:hypothetical protein [Chloroflexota bacterium]
MNAHLNRFLQSSGWESFHGALIETMVDMLDPELPDHYIVTSDESLQISAQSADESVRTIKIKPHLTAYPTGYRRRSSQDARAHGNAESLTLR